MDTTAIEPTFPLWAVFCVTVAVSVAAAEIGEYFGKRARKRRDGPPPDDLGTLVGAMLGVLGFILAITFGSQITRFETYRQLELEEAMDIEATWLRADMLAPPQREQVKNLLAEYLRLRIEEIGGTLERSLATIERSAELQDEIWALALLGTEHAPDAYPRELFMESLTQLINVHTARVTVGVFQRMPTVLWIILEILIMMAMAVTGYQGGLSGSTRPFARTMAVIAFATLVLLISDLNRPESGLLKAKKAPLKLVQDRVVTVPLE